MGTSNNQTPPRLKLTGPHPEQDRKFKVLLIDDEVVIHKLFKATFPDWEVESAYSKYEVEPLMDANGHQVIVLDIVLPGVAGYELMDLLRTKYGRPVVVISANVTEENYRGFIEHGAFAVLEKGPPWPPWKIRQAVEAAWDKFRTFLDDQGVDTVVEQLRAYTRKLREET